MFSHQDLSVVLPLPSVVRDDDGVEFEFRDGCVIVEFPKAEPPRKKVRLMPKDICVNRKPNGSESSFDRSSFFEGGTATKYAVRSLAWNIIKQEDAYFAHLHFKTLYDAAEFAHHNLNKDILVDGVACAVGPSFEGRRAIKYAPEVQVPAPRPASPPPADHGVAPAAITSTHAMQVEERKEAANLVPHKELTDADLPEAPRAVLPYGGKVELGEVRRRMESIDERWSLMFATTKQRTGEKGLLQYFQWLRRKEILADVEFRLQHEEPQGWYVTRNVLGKIQEYLEKCLPPSPLPLSETEKVARES
ncbi:hypothetical protein HDU89_003708 [Geranomyces variabilis]|nr:hypothetical protein HDU89_003708 [Geranomyces variabilis]